MQEWYWNDASQQLVALTNKKAVPASLIHTIHAGLTCCQTQLGTSLWDTAEAFNPTDEKSCQNLF